MQAIYPVHYSVEPAPSFSRLQLLVRFAAFVALGLVGVSFGAAFLAAYFALPVLAALAWCTGCAIPSTTTPSADHVEVHAPAGASVYLGWRVFEARCAGCHGDSASGKSGAPDLLASVPPESSSDKYSGGPEAL